MATTELAPRKPTFDIDKFLEERAFGRGFSGHIAALPLYIFDLDGTLALNGHRKHLVEAPMVDGVRDPAFKPDWSAFYRACTLDEPNWPVISTMLLLLDKGCDVQIWSGREASVMNETRAWLQKFISEDRLGDVELIMRREGDFTPDDQLKEAWLNELAEYDRRRLVAVFDDRDKVVAMWRRNSVVCFQVAPGEF